MVIVDTCIWSCVLRRTKKQNMPVVKELQQLIQEHRVEIIGAIRQEILSGIKDPKQFNKLKDHLSSFPDIELSSEDYVTAARFYNICRSNGIQGSNTDYLICAVAVNRKFSIYTTDKDFTLFAKYLPIELHNVR